MILLELFLTFLEIGAVSFGGGYAMISLIKDRALAHNWLTEDELLNMIAVSESTPGPIAVNIATFVGSKTAGLPGALLATLGVVLPSFIIILLIAVLIKNFIKLKPVSAFLRGARPSIAGLILATASTLILSSLLGISTLDNLRIAVDYRAVGIIAFLIVASIVYKRAFKRQLSPIITIVFSALLGAFFYSI